VIPGLSPIKYNALHCRSVVVVDLVIILYAVLTAGVCDSWFGNEAVSFGIIQVLTRVVVILVNSFQ
jgi:hypothetical protein